MDAHSPRPEPDVPALSPPTSEASLSVEWLRQALAGAPEFEHSTLTGYRCERIGEGRGFTSHVFRVHLELAGPASAPRSLVAKLSSPASDSRALTKTAYERESVYYQRFESESPVPGPRCYHVSYEPEEGHFVLLLEDLHGFDGGDQLEGTTLARAETAVDALAKLHAHFWNDGRVLESLGRIREDVDMSEATTLFQEGLAELERTQGHRYPRLVQVAGALVRLINTPGLDRSKIGAVRPPYTLLHGDFRLDNLFFADDDARPMAAIDWVVRAGRPPMDLAYFMVGSLTSKQLREHGDALLKRYHAALVARGVEGYAFRKLVSDYESVMSQMVANQVLVQVMLTRSREGRLGVDGSSQLEQRLHAFMSEFADTERGVPLFETMVGRLEAALALHPRIQRRLFVARTVVRTRTWWRQLLGRDAGV